MNNRKIFILLETCIAVLFMLATPIISVLLAVKMALFAPTLSRNFFQSVIILIIFALILKVLSKHFREVLSKKVGMSLLLCVEIVAVLVLRNAVLGISLMMGAWFVVVFIYCASLFIEFLDAENEAAEIG